MVPCCRRHQPRPRETFLDDPQLLGIRPAPTPASIYNVKATHLTTISKDIHTDSQLQTGKNRKAAVLGRVRRKRRTPPSFRFLGRKVFLGAVAVLVSAMRQGATAERQLCELVGVGRRTIARWR